eukprot:636323-Alexandrium_andersonii.AAC.1
MVARATGVCPGASSAVVEVAEQPKHEDCVWRVLNVRTCSRFLQASGSRKLKVENPFPAMPVWCW